MRFLTVYPNYWGRGDTAEESKKQARKQGGRGTRWITYKMPEGATKPWVDDFGSIRWTWAEDTEETHRLAKPVMVAHGRGLKTSEV